MKKHQEPDWEKLLSDTIESAFHSGDFTQLKQTLGTTFENVMKQTSSGLKHIDEQAGKIFSQMQAKQPASPQQSSQQHPPQPTAQRVPSRYATDWQRPANRGQPRQKPVKLPSKKAAAIGIFVGLFFGICFLQGAYQAVTTLFSQPFEFSLVTHFLILLLLVAASFWLAVHCIGMFRKRRYLQYQLAIGTRPVCAVDVLAKAVNKSPKFVIRDLKSMIKTGLFPQGHLDDEGTCLILTDEAYGQYRTGQANRKLRELEEAKIQENPDGLEAVIAEGRGWIRKIREANDALPGQEISEKLFQLETVTGKIFACVEKHPEKLPEIRRFMNYYLPTTVKLVTSYREFENQPVQGENIRNAKQEILDILDTVNHAFASLLDSLFQNDAIDISADISVLKTMLAQEGLTQNEFDGPSR